VTVAGGRCWRSRWSGCAAFGVREVVVNAHHYAEMIVAYLAAHGNLGCVVEVSREESCSIRVAGCRRLRVFFWSRATSRFWCTTST